MSRIVLIMLLIGGVLLLRPLAADRALSAEVAHPARSTSELTHPLPAAPQDVPDRLQWREPSCDLRAVLQNEQFHG